MMECRLPHYPETSLFKALLALGMISSLTGCLSSNARAAAPAACNPSVGEANLRTSIEMLVAMESKNLAQVLSYFAESAVYATPYSRRGPDTEYVGKAAIGDAFTETFAFVEPLRYSQKQYTVSCDGRTVFIQAQGDMNFAADGREYDNQYVFRFDFDNAGKFARLIQYSNTYYLMQRLGRT